MKKNTRDYPKRQNFYTGGAAAVMIQNAGNGGGGSPQQLKEAYGCMGSGTDPDLCQRPWLERPYQPSGGAGGKE